MFEKSIAQFFAFVVVSEEVCRIGGASRPPHLPPTENTPPEIGRGVSSSLFLFYLLRQFSLFLLVKRLAHFIYGELTSRRR